MEILRNSYNTVNATFYSSLIIIDIEKNISENESSMLYDLVAKDKLNLVIFAEWYGEQYVTKE